MIRCTIVAISLWLISCGSSKQSGLKASLDENSLSNLKEEMIQMLENDQENRNYISIGTFDGTLIDSVSKLEMSDYIAFRRSFESQLTDEQEDSLWAIQHRYDSANTFRLFEIIDQYGWLTESQLDSAINPMIFLFHTPKFTIDSMTHVLYKEVRAGRMDPLDYATYVDNMRKKVFGIRQLYGTGQEFDAKSGKILPPIIDDLDSTNTARIAIGLDELDSGQYRLN